VLLGAGAAQQKVDLARLLSAPCVDAMAAGAHADAPHAAVDAVEHDVGQQKLPRCGA
jgi:hypothetical protein